VCAVLRGAFGEQSVDAVLNGAFLDSEALLISRLASIPQTDLSAGFNHRLAQYQGAFTHEC